MLEHIEECEYEDCLCINQCGVINIKRHQMNEHLNLCKQIKTTESLFCDKCKC